MARVSCRTWSAGTADFVSITNAPLGSATGVPARLSRQDPVRVGGLDRKWPDAAPHVDPLQPAVAAVEGGGERTARVRAAVVVDHQQVPGPQLHALRQVRVV